MKNFTNKIAVITGAASGIGRALALQCAKEKMKIVIADLNAELLAHTLELLKAASAEAISVITDVTNEDCVEDLAKSTLKNFGVPYLLFNNAGVGGTAEFIWEMSAAQLQSVLDINLLSMMHSIRAFVPLMLEHNEPAHIVNTVSVAGFYTSPYFSNYQISKHAALVLSECLHHDLRRKHSKINVSVLCPGWVKTSILKYALAKQAEQKNPFTEEDEAWILQFARKVRHGTQPEKIAEITFQAIKENKFYIFTHPEFESIIQKRFQNILAGGDPVPLIINP